MGVDAVIRVVPRRSLTEEEVFELAKKCYVCNGKILYTCEDRHCLNLKDDGGVGVAVSCRYYGPDYPRGPWPALRALMLWLEYHIGTVYYCGDCSDVQDQSPVDLVEIDTYWLTHGGEEYVRFFDRSEEQPECSFCKEPYTSYGHSGGDRLHRCITCGRYAMSWRKDGDLNLHECKMFETATFEKLKELRKGVP